MKLNYILIAAALLCIKINVNAQSPNWQWAKAIGGTNSDYSNSIAIDASGNIYTTGSFSGIVDFDPGAGTSNLTSAGNGDIFISKFDASGNLVWAKSIGGTAGSNTAQSIAIDASSNVYTTGWFYGTVDFDPNAGTYNLTSINFADIFISKLDSSGNFVWAKQIGGTISEDSYSIAIGALGDVYTTGDFTGTVDFDPGAGIFNLTGSGDIFISKLDSSGSFIWAKAIGGANTDVSYSITLDASENVYTTGKFSGTVDFDPNNGIFNLISDTIAFSDIFVSKLDSSGNFVWAKAIGGVNTDVGYSISINPAGSEDVYLTGTFYDTTDFNPDPLVTFNLTSAGNGDIFISKLDSSGNFVWAKAMGGISSDNSYSITLDPSGSGDVYTAGNFYGTADFDPGIGQFNLSTAGGTGIFISKLDASGNFVWAKSAGGTTVDYCHSISLNSSGNVYVTGEFESPAISFDTATLINADNSGFTRDIYIAKLDTALNTGNQEISHLDKMAFIYPNPASNQFIISLNNINKIVTVTITDIIGNIIYIHSIEGIQKLEVNTLGFAKGIYVVQIKSEDFNETEKIIKQ